MDNYPSNSNRVKKEAKTASTETTTEKKVKKVATARIVKSSKPDNATGKLMKAFVSDEVHNIKGYIIEELIIPTIKDTLWSAVTNSVSMILFGDKNHGGKKSHSRPSYSEYYDKNRNRSNRESDRPSRDSSRPDYENIAFNSKMEAKDVLDELYDILDEFEVVSVADLYEASGITDIKFTDNDYGWTHLNGSEAYNTRDGWKLKLPRIKPIK